VTIKQLQARAKATKLFYPSLWKRARNDAVETVTVQYIIPYKNEESPLESSATT
jgi:hypothetical protein